MVKFMFKRERVYDGDVIMKHLPTHLMLADSLSKNIVGIGTSEHKAIYMGLADMSAIHGVVEREKVEPTKPFRINHSDEVDETESFMVCHADLGRSDDE